jgi:hypothetical protein
MAVLPTRDGFLRAYVHSKSEGFTEEVRQEWFRAYHLKHTQNDLSACILSLQNAASVGRHTA